MASPWRYKNLIWGAFQPIAGGLADRYGSGRVIMGGGLLYAIGVIGMASAVTPTELLISGGVLIGLGMSGAGISVVYGAVARLVVPERRTYALAIVSTIGALGPFVLPKVTQVVIGDFGWYGALIATAVIVTLMIPLGGMMRGKAEDDGAEAPQSWTEALSEARKNRGYLLLVAGFFVCGFHVTFIGTHLPGFVAWCGLGVGVAGTALTIIGGGNIMGTYLAGVLSNRFRQKKSAQFDLSGPRGVDRLADADAQDRADDPHLLRRVWFPLVIHSAADQRAGRQIIRRPSSRHAVRTGVLQPPDRRVPGCLARGSEFRCYR